VDALAKPGGWLRLALMVMACPPTEWRSWSAAVLLIVVLTLMASELPRRRIPAILGIPSDHRVVIGDSIFSGIDFARTGVATVATQDRVWTNSEASGREVRCLADSETMFG
jgi:hypothetical protein